MAQTQFASETSQSVVPPTSGGSPLDPNDSTTLGAKASNSTSDTVQVEGVSAKHDPSISTVERIARNLTDRIIFGQLQPSERIQELKIAGELKVSRGSVREALLVLEGRHMVSILPRRGALVRPLNNNEIASIAQVVAQVTGTLFAEFAARRPTESALTALKEALAGVNAAVEADDLAALVQARQAFFEQPSESIDNDFTGNLLHGLSGPARRLMVQASRSSDFDPADTRRCVQALFDATAAHEGERARQILDAMLRRDASLASATA